MSPDLRMSLKSIRDGRGITFLVPFTPGVAEDRDRIWDWSRRHWLARLPGVQVIVADDPDHFNVLPTHPFSKAAAVNAAGTQARGDIVVIIDADAYVDAALIRFCAAEIRKARRAGRRLWYVPYRRFWRLSAEATERVLTSSPKRPWHPADPPAEGDVDPESRAKATFGSFFAAMVMVMPIEAFEESGGMDPRFNQGWGGEDISFKRQVDTIYGSHKTIDGPVYHLCHGTLGGTGLNREWAGQTKAAPFALLGARYLAALGDRARMLRLVDEWKHPTMTEEVSDETTT